MGSVNSALRTLMSDIMKAMPFKAYFCECPPVSAGTAEKRLFEFMVNDSRLLAQLTADIRTFSKHLSPHRNKPISVAFPNINKPKAILVAPAQATDDVEAYTHIAAFFRNAPPEQLDNQWLTLGMEINKLLQEDSTFQSWWNTEDLWNKLVNTLAPWSNSISNSEKLETNVWVNTEGSSVH